MGLTGLFFRPAKIRVGMAGIGNEGGACQLQCAILAVQPCPYSLGRREARSFASHCHPLGPKELHARSRPIAEPSLSELEPKANPSHSHQNRSNTVKHDQTRGPSKTIKHNQKRPNKCFFSPLWPQSQGHPPAPNCFPVGSMFFISCSFEHGREDFPLRVHTCGTFPNDFSR